MPTPPPAPQLRLVSQAGREDIERAATECALDPGTQPSEGVSESHRPGTGRTARVPLTGQEAASLPGGSRKGDVTVPRSLGPATLLAAGPASLSGTQAKGQARQDGLISQDHPLWVPATGLLYKLRLRAEGDIRSQTHACRPMLPQSFQEHP